MDFPTARGGPRSRRQHKKPALLVTIIRNQGRGVKCRPEGGHTPLKSSQEILPAIELEIESLDLPEWRIENPRIFHHRQTHFYNFTQQLQPCSEHKVSTQVEAFSHANQYKKRSKTNNWSFLTQQVVARIFEAGIGNTSIYQNTSKTIGRTGWTSQY